MEAQVIAGRYQLEHRLGSGGMSEVWAAQDLELDRTVAVKLLARDADPARFDREARAAAALSHPNIAGLYDYGEDGGRRFMVLEYLPGGSLEDRLEPGKPSPDDQTRRVAREIAAGLAHAHDRGLVHRDLKPSNILFDAEGRAKIADFGIARRQTAPGMTEAGTVLGTAAYISPEQAAGETAAPASDVYAFGVILFRMLTGRLPFESPDALVLVEMHRDQPAPPVSELRPDAPPLLESLTTAALAKSPADRPPNGGALLVELGAAAPAPPPGTTAVTEVIAPPPVPPRKRRRRLVLFLVAVAALAAAGVGLAVGVGSGDDGPSPPAPPSTSPTTSKSHPTTSTATFVPSPETATQSASTTTTAETTTAASTTLATTAPSITPPRPTTAPPATTAPTTTAPPPPPPTTTAPPATDTTATTATTTFTDTTATATETAPTTTAPPAAASEPTTTSSGPQPG